MPPGGTKVPGGSIIVLYLSNDAENMVFQEVPDITGMTGAQASRALGQRLLNIRITGANVDMKGTIAKKQDPEPGTMVPAGTVVTVTFINTEKVE